MEPVAGPPDLLIVARDRPLLYETFRRMQVGDADIEIIIDRRGPSTTRSHASANRRQRSINDALRTTGWALVPSALRRRPSETAAGPRGSPPPAILTRRSCFVTLENADVECLMQAVPKHSDGYHVLQAALDLGTGMMSVRCDTRVAEEMLFVARWNCPNAVEAIRRAIDAAGSG